MAVALSILVAALSLVLRLDATTSNWNGPRDTLASDNDDITAGDGKIYGNNTRGESVMESKCSVGDNGSDASSTDLSDDDDTPTGAPQQLSR